MKNKLRRQFAVFVKAGLLVLALLTGAASDVLAHGSIGGRVTSSTTGLGLAGTVVHFYDYFDDTGAFTAVTTDAAGNYTGTNLTNSVYRVVTRNTLGYINEIHNNIPCSATCNTGAATLVAVHDNAISGINFVLDPGGRITGTITSAATGLPIAGVRVSFMDANGELVFSSAVTNASGNYISDGGTATGNVFAFTTNTQGYRDEAYNNVYCLACDPTVGTPIPVTVGAGASGINFVLDVGGRITGTVTNAASTPLANVIVHLMDSTGKQVGESVTDGVGNYSTTGLPTGNYRLLTSNTLGLVDELYNNVACPGGFCNPTIGTLIPVTFGVTASAINFVLSPGGTISGIVTNAAHGGVLLDITVSIFNSSGTLLSSPFTTGSGHGEYSVVVPPGTYFAAVMNAEEEGTGDGVADFQNQLYNNLPCPAMGGCNVTSGTPIAVTVGATTADVNFALVPDAPPTITSVSNRATPMNTSIVVNFTVGDDGQNGPAGVSIAASSLNATLVPNANLVLGGSGAVRTLTITPAANRTGVTTITLTASDGVRSASTSFVVVVGTPSYGGDFDADGKAEIGVFRRSTGTWYLRYTGTPTALDVVWGGGSDIPVVADYDGDGKTDIAVFRPSTGTWYIRYTATPTAFDIIWGGGSDIPVVADYDGDGKADIAVFRPSTGTWYIRYTATPTAFDIVWGGGSDIPVVADYDGDGKADIAVFRQSTGTWYIRYTATPTALDIVWGGGTDIPVVADYDGDGKADIAVFRRSIGTWYIRYTATPTAFDVIWGGGTDIPVSADYDGDGKADIAVFRPSTGTWYIRYTATPTSFDVIWGGGSDIPVLQQP